MRAFSTMIVVLAALLASSAALAQAPARPCAGRPAAERALPAALRAGAHHVVIDGVRLWYRVAGRAAPGSPPVVFLHGGPGSNSQSLAAFGGPLLECAHRMIYLDQRGSGRSERPWTRDYAMKTLVEDIEGLRKHLGVPRIALIGHSFGTVLGLEYAAAYPRHVSHLVVAGAVADAALSARSMCARLKGVDAVAYAKAVEGSADGRCDVFQALRGREAEAFFRANMFPDPAVGARVDAAEAAGGLRNTGELQRAVFDAGLLSYRFTRPERLTMPVLIVSGAKDYQVGLEGPCSLAAQLPNARALEYPAAGHFMFADQPERFAADVSAFLKTGR